MNDGGNPAPQRSLSAESRLLLAEGVSLVLSRWSGLQMAVQDEWGGRNSRQKLEDLSTSILSWFSRPEDVLYIDDLEDMLDEKMESLFNAEFADGSIEEVAVELMSLHEECLEGKHGLLERLRRTNHGTSAISPSRQIITEDESDDDEGSDRMDDDGGSDVMDVEDPKQGNTSSQHTVDGWTFVTSRKNKGRKSN